MLARHRISRSTRSNIASRLASELLEGRQLLASDFVLANQPVIISEFVADSGSSLVTRTRPSADANYTDTTLSPDWIELLNVTTRQVDLSGMHLTDDANHLTKWTFPAGTQLAPGEYMTVFASGLDITDSSLDEGGRLHTNFRLSSSGTFLALTDQAGSILHAFSPSAPEQRPDVSFALATSSHTLLESGSPVEYLLPTGSASESNWQAIDFASPALQGKDVRLQSPVGFDRTDSTTPSEPAETIGPEPIRRASSDFSLGSIVVLKSAPFTTAGRVDRWSFYSEVSRTITPLVFRAEADEFQIVGIGKTRTSDGSGTQAFDFELQSGSDAVDGDGYFFGFKDGDNETNVAGVVRWASSPNDQVQRYNGPLSGKMIVGQSLTSGSSFGRAYSVQATTAARLSGPIATEITANPAPNSLYVRYPFRVTSTESLRALQLQIRAEDGFVAYLNGREVARQNAPDTLRFDSSATQDQSLIVSNVFQEYNISADRDALVTGNNLLAVHLLNSAQTPEALVDARLVGIDIPRESWFGYAVDPTPDEPNSAVAEGLADAPELSHSRGIYRQPFSLSLGSQQASAGTIYYTLDGSVPGPNNPQAQVYSAPLAISGTTNLRAVRYADNQLPSTVVTASYIFPADVIQQTTLNATIVNDPKWQPQLIDALESIPTISLVMPEKLGSTGEVATSIEMIYPDGQRGFQSDAGIEVYGGTAIAFAKQSFRLTFKNPYGPAELDFDVFDDPQGVSRFNQLLLRAGSHDTPFYSGSVGAGAYLRNRWATDRQLELGQPAPRSRFAHVYLNGVYWGQYDLMERPDASFAAATMGGEPSDYDALNAGRAIDGDVTAYNTLLNSVGQSYEEVQKYLDVDNYADYLLLEFFGGNNIDWSAESNWMATRRRATGAGFQFYAWDSDIVLRSGLQTDIVNYGGPGFLWTRNGGLRQYPEFLELLATKAQTYFLDGGIFSPERLRTQIDDLAAEMRLSILTESARWGGGLYTPDTWESAIAWIKDTYAPAAGPSRGEIVIEQLRRAGVFPLASTPNVQQNGQTVTDGILSSDVPVTLSAPAGEIYYTFDGSDPREDTPSLATSTLIGTSSSVRYFIPEDNNLGNRWIQPDFNDTSWAQGTNGLGYEASVDFAERIATDVGSAMLGKNSSLLARYEFQVSDPNAFDSLSLGIQFDDGFVAFLNGVEVARRNAPSSLAWNSRSTIPRANIDAKTAEPFELTPFKSLLVPGKNVLAIQGLNSDPANNDFFLRPELRAAKTVDPRIAASAQRFTNPISVPRGATLQARTLLNGQWSVLRTATDPAALPSLRITELMYHAADPSLAEIAAGFSTDDDFDYIEIMNTGSSPIDLSLARLTQQTIGGETQGVDFAFASGSIRVLNPGQRVVVAEDLDAIQFRYGPVSQLAGQWTGGLSNRSERLTLEYDGTILQQFDYRDVWRSATDGPGYSLELIDPQASDPTTWNSAAAWRVSPSIGGSPGTEDTSVPGDVNRDGIFNSTDLVLALQAGEYEDAISDNSVWTEGDWNGDGDFNSADFVFALQGYRI